MIVRTALGLAVSGLLFIAAAWFYSYLGHVYDIETANCLRMSAVRAHRGGYPQYEIDEERAALDASSLTVLLAGPLALVLLIAAFAYKDARRASAVLVVLSALASIGSLATSKYAARFIPVARETRR
jgi:hypothetical protein